MKPPKKKPCPECPFRRQSLPGYVGNDDPAHFQAMAHHGERPMPCHVEVDYDDPDWPQIQEGVHQCTGQAIYLGNICKSPRNREVVVLPADRTLVFSRPIEFLEHHGLSPEEAREAATQGQFLLWRDLEGTMDA